MTLAISISEIVWYGTAGMLSLVLLIVIGFVISYNKLQKKKYKYSNEDETSQDSPD